MNTTYKKNYFYAMVAFLLSPFLSAVAAFRSYRSPWAKNLFWAFCAFYGFTFAIGTESQGSDIMRYITQLQDLYEVDMTFTKAVDYFAYSGEVDILRTLIAVTLSRFTDNPAILTLIYGIIFGFFFSRNLWYVMERLEGKILPVTILLLACFFLVNPIWKINGFRMWTAAHIFIYGLLPYLCEGKKRGIWIACSSILVHFAFLVPILLLLGYIFLGNRLTLYFFFFISTFFISGVNMTVFNYYTEDYMPEVVQERTSSYRTDSAVSKMSTPSSSQRVWYARWYRTALEWSLSGFLIILYWKNRKFIQSHKSWLSLVSFTLLLFAAANILRFIPSGGRYLTLAYLCALPLCIFYVQNIAREKMLKRYLYLAAPALFLFAIVSLRIGFYSLSATSILGNPLIALFTAGENYSLNDFIRMLL
ncbi:MAG: hypothetical protein ACFCU6_16420 [Balneolaceae bacterium]